MNQQGNQALQEQLNEGKRINVEILQKNSRQIDLSRIVLFMAAGTICGVLGFTGLNGFLFFLGSSCVIAVATAVLMSFDTKRYTNESLFSMILTGLTSQIMSFIMFWTLAYSLVRIY
jgi:hypothetical protein|tara:strand:- start:191 stop:541 length:351 start_codon:yes stop_codon:yes gene_type:complete